MGFMMRKLFVSAIATVTVFTMFAIAADQVRAEVVVGEDVAKNETKAEEVKTAEDKVVVRGESTDEEASQDIAKVADSKEEMPTSTVETQEKQEGNAAIPEPKTQEDSNEVAPEDMQALFAEPEDVNDSSAPKVPPMEGLKAAKKSSISIEQAKKNAQYDRDLLEAERERIEAIEGVVHEGEGRAVSVSENWNKLMDKAGVIAECINPEVLGASPITKDGQTIIPLKFTDEIVKAIERKVGETLVNIVISESKGDPAVRQALRQNLIEAVKKLDEGTIKLIKELAVYEIGSFEKWLKDNNLDSRYASKIDANTSDGTREFAAIPVYCSENGAEIKVPQTVVDNFSSKLSIVQRIAVYEADIKGLVKDRNEKITPEDQAQLDKLFALEEENKKLAEQIKTEKESVSGNEADLEKEKKNAEDMKKSAEEALENAKSLQDNAKQRKATAESSLNAARSNLQNARNAIGPAEGKLSAAKGKRDSKQNSLKALNTKKTSNATLKKLRQEYHNKKLNKKTAASRLQNDINAANGEINAAQGALDNARANVSNHEKAVADNEAAFNQANSEIESAANAEEKARQDIQNATLAIQSVEQRLEDMGKGYTATEKLQEANAAEISKINTDPGVAKAKVDASEIDPKINLYVGTVSDLFRELAGQKEPEAAA